MSLPAGPSRSNESTEKDTHEKICYRLTATGRGAVAVIAVQSQTVIQDINQLFTPVGRIGYGIKSPEICYGHWTGSGESSGEDLIIRRVAEDHLEIHCHGGDAAPQAIVDALEQSGYRLGTTDERILQTVGSRWLREIDQALTLATTETTARWLLDIRRTIIPQIESLRRSIVANQEPTIETGAANEASSAIARINRTLNWAHFGQHLTRPYSVVLCGRPNVGKSSLINAIAGFERAIVHPTAGTTRDVVSQATAVQGWPVTLSDTAGWRDTENQIEQQGIERALKTGGDADLVIGVFDGSQPWTPKDSQFVNQFAPQLIVFNKTDIANQANIADENDTLIDIQANDTISVSAKTSSGISELLTAIGNKLVPSLPPKDSLIPINRDQTECLQQILKCLQSQNTESAIARLDAY